MTRDEHWLLTEKYAGVATPEFDRDRDRLADGEPVAYVVGTQPFLGLVIHLDSRPLIPRPETEWWTNELIANLEVQLQLGSWTSKLKFLDLCAGSGAIGCAALKYLPNTKVYFGEINPVYEATIRKNIAANNLDASCAEIRIGNLFEPFAGMTFDLIAANPPYIPASRILPESVAKFESPTALFAGPDGLAIIRRIAEALPTYLAPHGQAWIECDSEHAEAARALFERAGLTASIRTDQYSRPRFLVVSFP